MKTMRTLFAVCSIVVVLLAPPTLAQGEPIVATDLLKLRTVGDVEIAPDGAFVVYTVRSIHEKEDGDYEYRTHLWRVDLRGDANPRALTTGERGGSSPAISHDAATLAFVRSGEGEDAKGQVWLLPLSGPGEARQLTELEHGAGSPVWRPDGDALLVTSAIPLSKIDGTPAWDMERPKRVWKDAALPDDDSSGDEDKAAKPRPDGDRESMRRWLAKNASRENPVVINRLDFQGEQSLAREMRFAHLFIVDVETGEAEQLTDGFVSHGQATWSPDGSLIAFTDAPRTNTHPDRYTRSLVYRMDADGSNVRTIAGDETITASSPEFLPDGEGLIVEWRETDGMWYRQTKLAQVSLDGGLFRRLAPEWGSHVGGVAIERDGDIWFTSRWHGAFPLKALGDDGAVARSWFDSGAGAHAVDAEANVAVAAVTTPEHPVRLLAIDQRTGRERVLHDLNEWTVDKTLSMPTEARVSRADGERVQYWVMPPTGAERGRTYPTVLEIHGGPSAMWGPGELSMWHEFQLLASWGYGVVYSNPRGSSGYGYEFQRGNHENWGEGPTGDVLAALDEASESTPWIDDDRLFVTGGSYAGYLTAWIVAHDHRFKAAVAQRGVYDLATFFGEGNAWRLVPWAFGGYPWEQAPRLELQSESPFTFVDRIRTPLLIMHASQDLRTGVTQSEMMYRALKVQEKPVEYVRYPGAGHDLSRGGDPKQRIDRLLRIVEFFERYAENKREAPTIKQDPSASE